MLTLFPCLLLGQPGGGEATFENSIGACLLTDCKAAFSDDFSRDESVFKPRRLSLDDFREVKLILDCAQSWFASVQGKHKRLLLKLSCLGVLLGFVIHPLENF